MKLGGPIIEFVGLRAKVYAYKLENNCNEKKCMGIKKADINKCITFDDYTTCLFSDGDQYRKMDINISHSHQI